MIAHAASSSLATLKAQVILEALAKGVIFPGPRQVPYARVIEELPRIDARPNQLHPVHVIAGVVLSSQLIVLLVPRTQTTGFLDIGIRFVRLSG